jgi:hypothetical protein
MTSETIDVINITPPALTAERQEWLVDGLVEALPGMKMRELFAVRRDMFVEADLITVAVSQPAGRAIGALSSRWVALPSGPRLLHITTQFVGERYQHGVVFRRSWTTHLAQVSAGPWGFPTLSALKTYNPRVYCAMSSFTRVPEVTFYPAVNGTAGGAPALRLASQVAATIAPGHPFDPATGVIADAGVPADLYRELPRSADPAVNEYFVRSVRPQDRVLCMLMVPTAAVAAVARHFTAPRELSAAGRSGRRS